jgi:hypothetical protein
MRVLAFLLCFSLSVDVLAVEKKDEKKSTKKVEKKKAAAPAQDWGRFNTKGKADLQKLEKKDKK